MATNAEIVTQSLNTVRDELSLFNQDDKTHRVVPDTFAAQLQRILEALTEAVEALADEQAGVSTDSQRPETF